MCEACGPIGPPERVSPELMEQFRETLRSRGVDPYAVTDSDSLPPRGNRLFDWLGRLIG